MTEQDEIAHLWGLALTKKSGWQHSDFPVVRDKSVKFAEAWKKYKGTPQLSTGKPLTVELVEQYWVAEARSRRQDRERGINVPQPVGITVWFNDGRWDNGVTASIDEPREQKVGRCQCGQPTHGPNFTQCDHCMGFKDGKLNTPCADELRAYAKQHNIMKMSRQECIDFINKGHKNILLDKR